MASLKRMLNDYDEYEYREEDHARNSQKRPRTAYLVGDDPQLETQPWPDLWGELFDLDHTLNDDSLVSDQSEATISSIWPTEADIDAWALQNFLPFEDTPSTPVTPTSDNAVRDAADPAPEQVCYGMIYREAAQLVGHMSQVEGSINSGRLHQIAGQCVFGIISASPQMFLTLQDGTKFGILNKHATEALEKIIHRPSLHLEALADLISLRQTISRASKAREATFRVSINVYGPRKSRDEVGRQLSSSAIWLQHPDHQTVKSTYDNPHILTFPALEIADVRLASEAVVETTARVNDAEQLEKTLVSVYASLTRSSHLNRLEGDIRLKTSLRPHQQEALDFMIQRELGPVPPEFSLWKPMESNSQHGFRHVITSAESANPPLETGGGVLADEMGLGKTYSILSLITRTLDDAQVWENDSREKSSSDFLARKPVSRATLVIVSSALVLNTWFSEIDKHLDGTLKVNKYHGPKRESDASALADADIVVTTYHTLTYDYSKKSSPLHDISWFRIVLDEAHIIRRRATTFNQTVSQLKGKFRWCLTGTPIQNTLEDIGALFAFVRAYPFDSLSTFRRFIANPFTEGRDGRDKASTRLTKLLDSVCLRRTKDILDLPGQTEIIRTVTLSPDEREQYELTKNVMNRLIRQKVGEVDKNNAFGMFHVHLQLRIFCNHGTFQRPFSWSKRHNMQIEREAALSAVGQNGEIRCSFCRQSMPIIGTNRVYRKEPEHCPHVLCFECLNEIGQQDAENGTYSRCVLCGPIDKMKNVRFKKNALCQSGDQEEYLRPHGYSSKMATLLTDVKQDLWSTKSVIFSCWTTTLNLIERHLRQASIPFGRIDGDCPLRRRQRTLDDFATKKDMPVLIMTTGTGAFGLNLGAANRIFMVEPQWNPSVENQAIARALRLDQEHIVQVRRYIVERTVEQELRSQQDKKLELADIGWQQSSQT